MWEGGDRYSYVERRRRLCSNPACVHSSSAVSLEDLDFALFDLTSRTRRIWLSGFTAVCLLRLLQYIWFCQITEYMKRAKRD